MSAVNRDEGGMTAGSMRYEETEQTKVAEEGGDGSEEETKAQDRHSSEQTGTGKHPREKSSQ